MKCKRNRLFLIIKELKKRISNYNLSAEDLFYICNNRDAEEFINFLTDNKRDNSTENEKLLSNLSKSKKKTIEECIKAIANRMELQDIIEKIDEIYECNLFFILKMAFNIIILVFSLYVVMSSIYIKYHNKSISTEVIIVSVLLFLIWILEGLQMSASQIRWRDIPPNIEIAKFIQDKLKQDNQMWQFLAGRQFLVVLTVFFVAIITSTNVPNYFPFLNIHIPLWFKNTIGVLFWRLGVGGALIVLWFSQLSSQYVATKHPVEFSDKRLMKILLKISNFFNFLSIPGEIIGEQLAKGLLSNHQDNFPSSLSHRFDIYSEDLGFKVFYLNKTWYVYPSKKEKNLFIKILVKFLKDQSSFYLEFYLFGINTSKMSTPNYKFSLIKNDGRIVNLNKTVNTHTLHSQRFEKARDMLKSDAKKYNLLKNQYPDPIQLLILFNNLYGQSYVFKAGDTLIGEIALKIEGNYTGFDCSYFKYPVKHHTINIIISQNRQDLQVYKVKEDGLTDLDAEHITNRDKVYRTVDEYIIPNLDYQQYYLFWG